MKNQDWEIPQNLQPDPDDYSFDLERALRAGLELCDVGDLAAHHRDPVVALLDARTDLRDQPAGPGQPPVSPRPVPARGSELGQHDRRARGAAEVAGTTVQAVALFQMTPRPLVVVEGADQEATEQFVRGSQLGRG